MTEEELRGNIAGELVKAQDLTERSYIMTEALYLKTSHLQWQKVMGILAESNSNIMTAHAIIIKNLYGPRE